MLKASQLLEEAGQAGVQFAASHLVRGIECSALSLCEDRPDQAEAELLEAMQVRSQWVHEQLVMKHISSARSAAVVFPTTYM